MVNRDRGILTESDREYLRMSDEERLKEYSAPARSQRRSAIVERVENAFHDLPLLARELDDEILEELFSPKRSVVQDEDGDDAPATTIPSTNANIPFGIALLIRATLADETRAAHPRFGVEQALSPLINHTENGVEMVLNEHYALTADVGITIEAENLRRLEDYHEQLEDRDEPVTGLERIEATSRLARAGYTDEQIASALGVPGDRDSGEDDVDE